MLLEEYWSIILMAFLLLNAIIFISLCIGFFMLAYDTEKIEKYLKQMIQQNTLINHHEEETLEEPLYTSN
jgi:hypothetical protein